MADNDITSEPRTVVLTGPTRGLGRLTALELAALGCELVLLGRPSAAFDTVVEEARIAGAVGVHRIEVDVASLASVARAAGQVVDLVDSGALRSVDALVGNAGVQGRDRLQQSEDGYELTFAVNVIANHVLVERLVPALSADAHVVIVGSGTHYGTFPTTSLVAAPVWADPATLARPGAALPSARPATSAKAGQCAYSTSKLAVNYLVHAAQREFVGGIRFNVFDPGMMPGTGLARDLPRLKQWVWNRVLPALVPVIPGASRVSDSARLLAAFAVGRSHPQAKGAYVEIDHLADPSPASFDRGREDDLRRFCGDVWAAMQSPHDHA